MLRFVLRRLVTAVVMLFVIGTVVFSVLFMVPGDPAELLLTSDGAPATQTAIENLRVKMGLNRPVAEQYVSFLVDTAQLDFGRSIIDDTPVGSTIRQRLPRTLELIVVALILALITAIPAGTYAGLNAGRRFDTTVSAGNAFLASVPGFVIGTLFVYFFAQQLRILPAGGYVPFAQDPWSHVRLLILPAVTVALDLFTIVFRMTRTSVLEMRAHDWVRTAIAKGLRRRLVVQRHILRNALGPVVTVVGLRTGIMLGSTVLVEFIYNWPGLSGYLVTAVVARDYPTVRAVILTVAAIFIVINLVVEVIHSLLDPRIRVS